MRAAQPEGTDNQAAAQEAAATPSTSPDENPPPRTKAVPYLGAASPQIPAQRSRPLLDSSLPPARKAKSSPGPKGPRMAGSKVPLMEPASGVDHQGKSVHVLLAQVQESLQLVQKQLQAARLRPGKSVATVQLVQPRLVSVADLPGAISL